MYPKLIGNSYIKIKPDELILSTVINKKRTNISINDTAFEILELCTGEYSIDNIVHIMAKRYGEKKSVINNLVIDFLTPFIDINVIKDLKSNKKVNIVKGNKNLYYPDALVWEITTLCPLDCKHCYLSNKNGYHISKNDIDYILNIISETGISIVQLTGGELRYKRIAFSKCNN